MTVEDIDALEILSFVDGERNISQIKREVDMTYKTVFYKIKDFERIGIVGFNKNKIPFLTPKHREYVKDKIYDLRGYKLIISKIMADGNRKKRVIKALNLLVSKRWVSDTDFRKILFDDYNDFTPEMVQFFSVLSSSGILRTHPEITNRGKNFLKQNK